MYLLCNTFKAVIAVLETLAPPNTPTASTHPAPPVAFVLILDASVIPWNRPCSKLFRKSLASRLRIRLVSLRSRADCEGVLTELFPHSRTRQSLGVFILHPRACGYESLPLGLSPTMCSSIATIPALIRRGNFTAIALHEDENVSDFR